MQDAALSLRTSLILIDFNIVSKNRVSANFPGEFTLVLNYTDGLNNISNPEAQNLSNALCNAVRIDK